MGPLLVTVTVTITLYINITYPRWFGCRAIFRAGFGHLRTLHGRGFGDGAAL